MASKGKPKKESKSKEKSVQPKKGGNGKGSRQERKDGKQLVVGRTKSLTPRTQAMMFHPTNGRQMFDWLDATTHHYYTHGDSSLVSSSSSSSSRAITTLPITPLIEEAICFEHKRLIQLMNNDHERIKTLQDMFDGIDIDSINRIILKHI